MPQIPRKQQITSPARKRECRIVPTKWRLAYEMTVGSVSMVQWKSAGRVLARGPADDEDVGGLGVGDVVEGPSSVGAGFSSTSSGVFNSGSSSSTSESVIFGTGPHRTRVAETRSRKRNGTRFPDMRKRSDQRPNIRQMCCRAHANASQSAEMSAGTRDSSPPSG